MTPLWTHLFGANPCWQRHSECSTHAEGPKRWKNLEGGDAWDVAMPCLWYFVVPFCRTEILTNICWCYPVIMSSKHLRTHSSTQQTTFGDTLRWQGVPCLDRFSPVIKMCTVPWWIMRDTQGAINLQIMFIQPVSGKEGDGLLYGVFLSVLLELHSLFCWFPNFPTMLVIAHSWVPFVGSKRLD